MFFIYGVLSNDLYFENIHFYNNNDNKEIYKNVGSAIRIANVISSIIYKSSFDNCFSNTATVGIIISFDTFYFKSIKSPIVFSPSIN